MKSEIKTLLWSLTLLALFSAPHVASAYYDPGVQRWINRDPLGEPGFQLMPETANDFTAASEGPNLYAFVKNDPVDRMDPFGETDYALASTSQGVGFCGCLAACWLIGPGDDALYLAAAGFGGKAAMDRLVKKFGKKMAAKLLAKLAASSAAKCAGPIGIAISAGTAGVCACFCAKVTGGGSGSSPPPVISPPPYSGGSVNAPPVLN